MKRFSLKALSALTALTLIAAVPAIAFAGSPHATGRVDHVYQVRLTELNHSGVTGHAVIQQRGDQLRVLLTASGLESGLPHAQHIHGFTDSSINAVCPPATADTNGDGYVDVGEGGVYYGGFVNSLTTSGGVSPADALALDRFPVADAGGAIHYDRSFTTDATNLQNDAIVLHGLDLNGSGDYATDNSNPLFEATLPVACGQIVQVR